MSKEKWQKHPSIEVTDAVRKELLENLTKPELIEEVEWLKNQREHLIAELHKRTARVGVLEHELNEIKLDKESK